MDEPYLLCKLVLFVQMLEDVLFSFVKFILTISLKNRYLINKYIFTFSDFLIFRLIISQLFEF